MELSASQLTLLLIATGLFSDACCCDLQVICMPQLAKKLLSPAAFVSIVQDRIAAHMVRYHLAFMRSSCGLQFCSYPCAGTCQLQKYHRWAPATTWSCSRAAIGITADSDDKADMCRLCVLSTGSRCQCHRCCCGAGSGQRRQQRQQQPAGACGVASRGGGSAGPAAAAAAAVAGQLPVHAAQPWAAAHDRGEKLFNLLRTKPCVCCIGRAMKHS